MNRDWNITSDELRTILADRPDSITLIDVREPEEYEENRIEGCRLMPLGEIMNRAEMEIDREADIILYCAHGVRSVHALLALQTLGFKKLRSLEGGICAYLGIE